MNESMVVIEYTPQSYKWDRYVLIYPKSMSDIFGKKTFTGTVYKRIEGNKTVVTLSPEGNTIYAIDRISFSGEINEINDPDLSLLCLADQGGWSGGRNYTGFIIGKLGSIIKYKKKSYEEYYGYKDKLIGYQKVDSNVKNEVWE